jgi:hypothetical protein
MTAAAVAGFTATDNHTLNLEETRKATEEHGSRSEVLCVKPGDCKEVSAIEVQVTINGQPVECGVLKKEPEDLPGTVKAYVVILDGDGQYEVLLAEGPGVGQRWRVKYTDTDEAYCDARTEPAGKIWCKPGVKKEVRRVGAAHIANLCKAGTPAALDDIKYILREASKDGRCQYTPEDLEHAGIRSTLWVCQPCMLGELRQLFGGAGLAIEVSLPLPCSALSPTYVCCQP